MFIRNKFRTMLQLFLMFTLIIPYVISQCINGNPVLCSFGFGNQLNNPRSAFNSINTESMVQSSLWTSVGNPNSCLGLNTVPASVYDMYRRQPIYSRVVNDSPNNRQLDSVCTTMFPLSGVKGTFTMYNYITFIDGSSTVGVALVSDGGIGENRRANPQVTITDRFFSFIGGNTLVGCSIQEFGEPTGITVIVLTFGPLNDNNILEAQQIVNRTGLAPEGLYVLPFSQPVQCVTQQVCQITNSLRYTQGGNTDFPNIYSGGMQNLCSAGQCV